MDQQRLQQEPSMEEILASIRRIISEDEAASNKSRAPTGPTMPASANGTQGNGHAPTQRHAAAPSVNGNVFADRKGAEGPAAAAAPLYSEIGPAGAPSGGYAPGNHPIHDDFQHGYDQDYGEETVLDLTEMVAEDGSVVTIAPAAADGQNDAQGDYATYDDQGAYDDTLYADPAGYEDDEHAYVASGNTHHAGWNGQGAASTAAFESGNPMGNPAQASATNGATAPEPILRQGSRDDAGGNDVGGNDARRDGDPRTVPAPRNAVRLNTALAALAGGDAKDAGNGGAPAGSSETRSTAETPTGTTGRATAPENSFARGSAGSRDDASVTAAARGATADFLESSALEAMIRETMKPMLREWLDNNLSRLVEDVARQELHRMIESRGGL